MLENSNCPWNSFKDNCDGFSDRVITLPSLLSLCVRRSASGDTVQRAVSEEHPDMFRYCITSVEFLDRRRHQAKKKTLMCVRPRPRLHTCTERSVITCGLFWLILFHTIKKVLVPLQNLTNITTFYFCITSIIRDYNRYRYS